LKGRRVLAAAVKTIAAEKGATPAQVALAWLLGRKPWIVPIPGTTRLERVQENIGAADLDFDAEDMAQIGKLFAPIIVHGDRYAAATQAQVDAR
jgi:aryl-alcohol dehydrogenase-like predicted oxidoreductase